MARKRETPAVVAGVSVGSHRTDTRISEQLQHLAARHHIRPALLDVALIAVGCEAEENTGHPIPLRVR